MSVESLPDGLVDLLDDDAQIEAYSCMTTIRGGQETYKDCRVTIAGSEKRFFDNRDREWIEVDSPEEFR